MEIDRKQTILPAVALNTAVGTTPEIPFADFTMGMIVMPSSNTATLLTFHAAAGNTGRPSQQAGGTAYAPTFAAAKDDTNTAITRTISSGASAIRIPLELAGAGAIKIVANAAVTVEISLKA